ncbi:Protein CBG25934 [Caenorhabditis briggsae]|uniref:Protein CBG25934 n=1 Tax=Caenorhabditis briggsae TaxID=6238 RepID=B6IK66_CAEBR|nr:Protein CBG25934 [Caenorhabditis briggsae]CAS00296.1 Protein CBG25934 [Caenorhabditis briggsae]
MKWCKLIQRGGQPV